MEKKPGAELGPQLKLWGLRPPCPKQKGGGYEHKLRPQLNPELRLELGAETDAKAEPSSGGAHWVVDNVVLGAGFPPVFTSQDDLVEVAIVNLVTKVPLVALDTDPDAVVSLSIIGAPDFVSLEPELAVPPEFKGELVMTPTFAHLGAYTIEIKALDENNLSAIMPYTFQVD